MNRSESQRGYILFESLIAILLLSIGGAVVQRAMGNAIALRGQAQDYTEARYLLEQVLQEAEIQPILLRGVERGGFGGEYSRFSWEREVSIVKMPEARDPETNEKIKLPAPHMTHIRATVAWTRSGQEYQETVETLYPPEKVYVPRLERLP